MFKGFTEDQMKKISNSLGYSGELDQFEGYLSSNKEASSKFQRMVDKATRLEKTQNFAEGGLVGQNIPFSKTSQVTQKKVNDQVSNPLYKQKDGMKTETATIQENANQLLKADAGSLKGPTPTAVAGQINDPTKTQAGSYQSQAVEPDVAKAAESLKSNTGQADTATIDPAQFDPQKLAQLGLEVPQIDETQKREATVQYQLTELMKQFEGDEPPAWAAGALRSVSSAMAARGIDSSSMAAQAATQAAMEAATAIAAADAQSVGQTNLANLDVRKSKMLSDAAAMSAMDMANLNNRQQAQVENARMLLETNFKNLDSRQQNEIFAFQARTNALLSDQAQENAAQQFNATNQTQNDQFFASLSSSVETQRANLQADVSKFNASIVNDRQKFEAENALVIADANAKWRQAITTTNTAAQNLSNQLNAQAVSRLQENAFNAMVQLERDEMAFVNDALTRAIQQDENARQRENDLVISALNRDATKELTEMGYQYQAGAAVGGFAADIAGDIISGFF